MIPNPSERAAPNPAPPEPVAGPAAFDASVLLERRLITRGRWTAPQWDAVAVIVGESGPDDAGRSASGERRGANGAPAGARPAMTLVMDDGERRQCLWSGLRVELFKDACEGYWYNLLSDQPRLFITCFHDDEAPDEDPMPVIVTANQDEAGAHMESDDWVFSVPMPEQAHQWVERFVVSHYEPEIKKKRKRRDWSAEADAAMASRRKSEAG